MYLYTPKHFADHELVPQQVITDRGSQALYLMNPQILEVADLLREAFGPAFINTYGLSEAVQAAYTTREHSGLRLAGSKYYRPYSQHSLGNAVDMVFRDISAQRIRDAIIGGSIVLPYNVVLEKDVSWLHIACANYRDKVTLVAD